MPTVCCTSSGHGGEAEASVSYCPQASCSWQLQETANTQCVARHDIWEHVVGKGKRLSLPRNNTLSESTLGHPTPPTGREPERQHHEDIADRRKTSQTTTNTHNTNHRALPQNLTGPARRASGGTTPTTKTAAQTAGIFVPTFSFYSLPGVDTCDTITPYRAFINFFFFFFFEWPRFSTDRQRETKHVHVLVLYV